jgi:hypothetical protein
MLCVKKSIEFASAEPPQLLSPAIDSDRTEASEHRPWCWDEAAPCGLGVAVPKAMQSAIAAGHHGVPFFLKKVIRKDEDVVWSTVGKGVPTQTYYKTSNGPRTVFYVPGLQ